MNQAERLAGTKHLAGDCLFAGDQIALDVGAGRGKAAAQYGGQFSSADFLPAHAAQSQRVAAKALKGDRNRGGCGAGIAIERTQRLDEFDGGGARRLRQFAHGAAVPAEAEQDEESEDEKSEP